MELPNHSQIIPKNFTGDHQLSKNPQGSKKSPRPLSQVLFWWHPQGQFPQDLHGWPFRPGTKRHRRCCPSNFNATAASAGTCTWILQRFREIYFREIRQNITWRFPEIGIPMRICSDHGMFMAFEKHVPLSTSHWMGYPHLWKTPHPTGETWKCRGVTGEAIPVHVNIWYHMEMWGSVSHLGMIPLIQFPSFQSFQWKQREVMIKLIQTAGYHGENMEPKTMWGI